MVKIFAGSLAFSLQIEVENYKSPEQIAEMLDCLDDLENQTENLWNKLHYMNGKHKVRITNQQLYDVYLSKRNKLSSPALYYDIPDKKPIFVKESYLSSHGKVQKFEEKVQKIIAKYKVKLTDEKKKEIKKLSKKQRQIYSKKQPKKDWLLSHWLQWGEENVDNTMKQEFLAEIQKMYNIIPVESKSVHINELSPTLQSDFASLKKAKTSRIQGSHCEDPINAFLFSVYCSMTKDKNIDIQNIDTSLWLLCMWKQHKTKVEQSAEINNFSVTMKTSIENSIIKPPTSSAIKSFAQNESALFPTGVKSQKEELNHLQHLDKIYEQSRKYMMSGGQPEKYKEATRKYSDSDLLFVTKVIEAKVKYINAIYQAPQIDLNNQALATLRPFKDSEKIGILGDWGTGLRDAFDLLHQLVKEGATIILHLGDVYYAGFDDQFRIISRYLDQLRAEFNNNDIRYYTIPGNHDFYTKGGPFYESLRFNNPRLEDQQTHAFFCLRNQSRTWQYIGLNTGESDTASYNVVNVLFEGAKVNNSEVAWAIAKINEFPGQTVLLTHHQAFSAHESIIGRMTNFGCYDQQVNHTLSQQLFKISPKVSVWFWGHEHRLVLFKPQAYGVPCSRLLGNSAFQVNQPNYYQVKYGEYPANLPIPMNVNNQGYYHHTGALVTHKQAQIEVKYIHMTSSYDRPSDLADNPIFETITRPIHGEVRTNHPYRIRDVSGLSFCSENTSYVWLHYTPTDFSFEKADDPNYQGPITPNMEIYIKIHNKTEYLYLNQRNDLNKSDRPNLKTRRFRFEYQEAGAHAPNIHTGDTLRLFNCEANKRIGRYYWRIPLKGYYTVSSGSSQFKCIQIYDPQENNSRQY